MLQLSNPYAARKDSSGLRRRVMRFTLAASFFALTLTLTLIAHFAHRWHAAAGDPALSAASELLVFGNVLLFAAALAYSAHVWMAWRGVGTWATALALASVLEMALGLSLHWLRPDSTAHSAAWSAGQSTLTLGIVLGMLFYLSMEAVYKVRSAGALVVPVFAAVALLQPQVHAASGMMLAIYCRYACVAATVTGYALLAVGALLAGLRLIAAHRNGVRRRLLVNERKADRLLLAANLIGFVVLLAATLLWETVTRSSISMQALFSHIELWILVVLIVYGGHLLLHFITRSSGSRTAFWALTNFNATLFGLSMVMLK